MAAVGIGSDTGGSVRIPSGLCGLAGFKPTQRRVPTTGACALSTTLDSIGPLAPTIACAARVHQVMAGEPVRPAIGGASGREGVCQDVLLPGVAVSLKKKPIHSRLPNTTKPQQKSINYPTV